MKRVSETVVVFCVVYLKQLWYSGNNMFGFHKCELAIQKYKNIKTDTLCVTLD